MKAFAKPSIHYNIKNVNISLGTNALICLWLKMALSTKNLSCMYNFRHGYLFYQNVESLKEKLVLNCGSGTNLGCIRTTSLSFLKRKIL